jgi:aspartyl/asparaginyl-tRNA synthetase
VNIQGVRPHHHCLLCCTRSDLEFIAKMVDKTAIERLEQVASSPFKRCSYTEAISLLEKAVAGGKKFEHAVRTYFFMYLCTVRVRMCVCVCVYVLVCVCIC